MGNRCNPKERGATAVVAANLLPSKVLVCRFAFGIGLAALKKLIQKARKLGFDPPPNGWPTATLADEEGTIYFNAKEDGNARNQGKRKNA